MLLKNIIKRKVSSAVENIPTLDNYYTTKKPKKAKAMKVNKGPYGGIGYPVGINADVSGGDGGGDGGGGE